MSEDKLDDIRLLLQDLEALLLLSDQDKIEGTKRRLLKPVSVENQVYELCDGNSTILGIATKIQKSTDYTRAVISALRRKGLVRTFERQGKTVCVQLF